MSVIFGTKRYLKYSMLRAESTRPAAKSTSLGYQGQLYLHAVTWHVCVENICLFVSFFPIFEKWRTFSVCLELQKYEWLFGKARNAMETQATDKCFLSCVIFILQKSYI